MHEFESDEEQPIFRRPLTAQQRVSSYRAKSLINGDKTIEVKLKKFEIDILDAIASKEGMSRVLLTSLVLRKVISESGYFISGGKLITPTFV